MSVCGACKEAELQSIVHSQPPGLLWNLEEGDRRSVAKMKFHADPDLGSFC